MKVIFIPDNPYLTKVVRPSELIKARTTERDYIESVLLTQHDDPSKFELRPETNFPGVSYIRRTHTTFTGHVDVSYDRAYVPVIIDSHIHSTTWDINSWSSLHTVVFTTDELWYHQLLHQYQSECLNDE